MQGILFSIELLLLGVGNCSVDVCVRARARVCVCVPVLYKLMVFLAYLYHNQPTMFDDRECLQNNSEGCEV